MVVGIQGFKAITRDQISSQLYPSKAPVEVVKQSHCCLHH